MKYENKKQIIEICEQIEELENTSEILYSTEKPIKIHIETDKGGIFMTNVGDSEFTPFATKMIDDIKQNITERIVNLHSQLEAL